jgi:xylulokinase
MEETRLVGVHLGTSSVRVSVYGADGEPHAGGEAPVGEQRTVAWERALREATPSLPSGGICSVASTSGTALLVDEYGEPVFPPQMYYESVSDPTAHVDSFDPADGPVGRNIALSPTSPLPKVLRLREAHPDRFEEVEWILSPTTWLLYRLRYGSSSRWRDVETDWTNALKFGADVTAPVPEWFDSLFEAADLSRSLFPTIRPPGSYVGPAESELAERTGFRGLKLYQGLTDGSASVLAAGCLEPGDFSLTFGAASVIKYVSESITPHDALYYHRHPLDGYLPGAAFDSGNVLRWFFDRVLDCSPERGLELAQSVPTGEAYEVFLQGNRSPFFDPSVGNSVFGLQYDTSLSTDEVHGRLARGLTSGIVLAEWTYLSLVEDHFDAAIDRVRLINDGAPVRGDEYDWWNELRASVWDRPVVEMESRTTVGPLIPPALLTSLYADVDEAADRLLRRRATVAPDAATAAGYDDRKEAYLDRWRRVADLYRRE